MKKILIMMVMLTAFMAKAQESLPVKFSHTVETTVSPEQIWAVWVDVLNWKDWDKGLKESYLESDFKLNANGKIIPDKGPKSTFVVSQFDEGKSYTFKTNIPFGKLIVRRSLVSINEKQTNFTHEVEFTGLFKKVFAKKLGQKYKLILPQVMQSIVEIAQTK